MNNKRTDDLVLGLIIIVVGVIFALRAFGIAVPLLFHGWWTLFLIIPGIVSVIKKGPKISNILAVLLGVIWLSQAQGWITFGIGMIWKFLPPIILLGIGTSIVVKALKKK